MSKAIKGLLIALVLFSSSAVASWYFQPRPAHDETAEAPSAPAATHGTKPTAPIKLVPRSVDEVTLPRPAVRSPHVPEAEAIAKAAADLQQQRDALRAREQQLAARQKNLELVALDVRKGQKHVDDLRQQVSAEMKLLSEKMDTLDRKALEARQHGLKAAEQTREMKQALVEVEEVEKGRIKQMAAFYNSMSAEAAAQTFQEMIDSGKLDLAAKILAGMERRQAANLLAQLAQAPGGGSTVQLLERLRGLKTAPVKEAR